VQRIVPASLSASCSARRSRRRDPALTSPLLYELLDKRQLLAGGFLSRVSR
jgi:hypothetical protein